MACFGDNIGVETPRRLGKLRISADVLLDFLRQDGTKVYKTEGIPADAKVVGMETCLERNEVIFLLESETDLWFHRPGEYVAEVKVWVSCTDAVPAEVGELCSLPT